MSKVEKVTTVLTFCSVDSEGITFPQQGDYHVPYAEFYQGEERDWYSHLLAKNWFTHAVEVDFLRAWYICTLLNNGSDIQALYDGIKSLAGDRLFSHCSDIEQ